MREYVITTDSPVDLPMSYLQEKGITVVPLSYIVDGATYKDMTGLTGKEFFDRIRGGSLPTTSQVNPDEVIAALTPILESGKDVLHIAFSSGLSGSCNSAFLAGEELKTKYLDANIIVVDSLCASLGEGLLLIKAIRMKEAGKSLEEVAKWVEENKLKVCHNVTIDDLDHLHRGGRVSKASAVIGGLIKIKPIIHMDNEGKLKVIGKERGRNKSIQKLIDMMEEQTVGVENDTVLITHGDCLGEAEDLARLVKERFKIDDVQIHEIGKVIGSHTGPGVVAVFFMGNHR